MPLLGTRLLHTGRLAAQGTRLVDQRDTVSSGTRRRLVLGVRTWSAQPVLVVTASGAW